MFVVVECDDGGLLVISATLNLGTFGKTDLVGVVVVGGNVFVIVVCDVGTGADTANGNDGTFDDDGGGGGLATAGEKNEGFKFVAIPVVGGIRM
jgi:hypothetical protein